MDETHVCVVDREGMVIHEGKSASLAEAIVDELAKAPSCRRIVSQRFYAFPPWRTLYASVRIHDSHPIGMFIRASHAHRPR